MTAFRFENCLLVDDTWRKHEVACSIRLKTFFRLPAPSSGRVALMLALPRPLQLERILPMVSSLGVTTLVLCHASKVHTGEGARDTRSGDKISRVSLNASVA